MLQQKTYSLKLIRNFLIYLLSVSTLFGQNIIQSSSSLAPSWIVESPTGKFYTYYTAMGISGSSLEAAQKQAVSNILSNIIMERSVLVQSELRASISKKSETIGRNTKTTIIDETVNNIMQSPC